jgi:hypothetical protein
MVATACTRVARRAVGLGQPAGLWGHVPTARGIARAVAADARDVERRRHHQGGQPRRGYVGRNLGLLGGADTGEAPAGGTLAVRLVR